MAELALTVKTFKTTTRRTYVCPCGDKAVITSPIGDEPAELVAALRDFHAACSSGKAQTP